MEKSHEMASRPIASTTVRGDEKQVARHDAPQISHMNTGSVLEDREDNIKPVADDVERDYTGAAKNMDPEEAKLVRKLDYRIMVSPGQI
jgi:hypothetical protein